MISEMTIAVVTCDRLYALDACLTSISHQKEKPREVILVDNGKIQGAERLCDIFRNDVVIRYGKSTTNNISLARNKAIQMCRTKYIGFTDDDCILDINWIASAVASIKNNPASFVVGKSMLHNNSNIFALAQFASYIRWFRDQTKHIKQVTPAALDTKNVIIKVEDLKRNRVLFDPRFGNFQTCGFEDIDLGLQLNRLRLFGNYNPNMVVLHPEVGTFVGMIKKAYFRGRLKYLLCHKWGTSDPHVNGSGKIFFLKEVIKLCLDRKKPIRLKVHDFTIICLTKLMDASFARGYKDENRSVKKAAHQ